MLVDILHSILRNRFRALGFQSRYYETGHFRIHYLQRTRLAARRNLVFIHGIGTSSSTWFKMIPMLKAPVNIICLDLPGHGFSKIFSTDKHFSMGQLNNAVESFLTHAVLSPFTLIGHSLGGWLSAGFAIRRPELVEHLILINNAGIYYDGVSKQAEAFDTRTIRDTRRLLDKLWFKYPWYFRPFDKAVHESLKERHIIEFVKSIVKDNFLNGELARLAMPTDIIWGMEDKLISSETVAIMKQELANANVHLIGSCGHVPQLERPKELARILDEILRSGEK